MREVTNRDGKKREMNRRQQTMGAERRQQTMGAERRKGRERRYRHGNTSGKDKEETDRGETVEK